jgi:hypothetical protein
MAADFGKVAVAGKTFAEIVGQLTERWQTAGW